VKPKSPKLIPVLIAAGVIAVVCCLEAWRPEVLERPELMTYDMRARQAARFHPTVATNLGFVCIDEGTIGFVLTNTALGYNYGLYWPRHVYGRVVSELSAQGAKAVAFDVIFGELRPDHAPLELADGRKVTPDEYFAGQLARAGNVILAVTPDKPGPPLFVTNAAAIGDIQTQKDFDGILRRAKAFRLYRHWHPLFEKLAADPTFAVNLDEARLEPGVLVLPRHFGGTEADKKDPSPIRVPLDKDGNFDLADLVGDTLPAGMDRKAKPFTEERIWHLGVQLAARELEIDLATAEVELPRGRITLRRADGLERVIPVDDQGYFYVDWALPPDAPTLTRQTAQELLLQDRLRREGRTNELRNLWEGKLAVIGSRAVGNDLNDLGATPLQPDTWLVSKHWNVANSIITGRFVRRCGLAAELALTIALGALTAFLTLKLRALQSLGLVVLLWTAYVCLAMVFYVNSRYWLPVFMPIFGASLINYAILLVYQVLFEQAERRRIRGIFSNMVSPKIVNELLAKKTLGLEGSRCQITVLFADVRGFTEFTDASHKRAADRVVLERLSAAQAEACFDAQASETLNTVNDYLGLVADTIIKNDGTLDKFIGDCVMAFWGAPTANARHALSCVQAAIGAQRAIHEMNRERAAENARREAENPVRQAGGLPPLPMKAILTLGTGINTGVATAGLMGSAQTRQFSYTVFGRDVNLASRLEGASGRGRIFISEATFEQVTRDDPALAATCIEQPEPLRLKGFSAPVRVFEVPWRLPDDVSPAEESPRK